MTPLNMTSALNGLCSGKNDSKYSRILPLALEWSLMASFNSTGNTIHYLQKTRWNELDLQTEDTKCDH